MTTKHTLKPHYITDKKGEKIAVIISWLDYSNLMEDLHDLTILAERKRDSTISEEIMKAKFKK